MSTPPAGDAARPVVAVIDMGASAVRLAIAEIGPDGSVHLLEDATRGVLLGKDTFTHGRITAATTAATLRVLQGFRRIMDGYQVQTCRAVATSAVREAVNADTFLDRVRLRTGISVEIIDGPAENRLTYLAVREALAGHEALIRGSALLAEIGGGSADLSLLRGGEPVMTGTYALGAIRMRQALAGWRGPQEQWVRLLRRQIHNVVDDIRRQIPLGEAVHFIALGGDARFAAGRLVAEPAEGRAFRTVPRDAFLGFCEEMASLDVDALVEEHHLHQAAAETLLPALLAYRELLAETQATVVVVPEASLRAGLLLDLARGGSGGFAEFRRQVIASAQALGEKYNVDPRHAGQVAQLAVRLFDDTAAEHGLGERDRLLLEVAALLHDTGIYISLRGHHKHALYLLSVSEIFGCSRDDMAIIANVARYHRRALPQKSHLPFMALDRGTRVRVSKMAAILRLANALDSDHLQKVRDVRVVAEDDTLALEVDGAGDLTMERLASMARADLFTDLFGRRVVFRETGER